MKKLHLLLFLVLPSFLFGQSQNQNYRMTTSYKVPTLDGITSSTGVITPDQKAVSIVYYDGLGRPIQNILGAQSSNGKDIITHIEYDEFGREARKYLPYEANQNSLAFDTAALSNTLNYSGYLNQNPYSENFFEKSPLNRIRKKGEPGADWLGNSSNDNDHTIKYKYDVNGASDNVLYFAATATLNTQTYEYDNVLTCTKYYDLGTLSKTVVKNENWSAEDVNNNTTEEFRDMYGKMVLKRAYADYINHDTYYVYDQFGNLCYVIPPLATEKLVTVTHYDAPYFYSQRIPLTGQNNALISSPTGGHVNGGGEVLVTISAGVLKVKLGDSGSWTGPGILDSSKTFPLTANNPVPDMEIGIVNFYNGGPVFAKYKGVVENNAIRFLTLVTPPHQFTGFQTYDISNTIPSSLFLTQPALNYTMDMDVLPGLCYQYKYDIYGRMVEKKLPGKQWEYLVYDKLDRIVATGPALSPFGDESNGWMITKYDSFDRVVYTGWMPSTDLSSAARISMQASRNSQTLNFDETKTAGDNTIHGVALRYTNNVLPNTTTYHVLSVNYYDDYNFTGAPATIPITILSDNSQLVYYNAAIKPKGISTGSWVRVPDSSTNYLGETSYMLYDSKSRIIRAHTINHYGGYTEVNSKIEEISGKLIRTETLQKRLPQDPEINIKEVYNYSGQDRLIQQTHQINNLPVEHIASNHYDPLGQLIRKYVGGQQFTGTSGYQKVDFTYNIRGWLTEINKVDGNTDSNDLFNFKINYNEVGSNSASAEPLYNGNVSQTYWRTASDNVKRKYDYYYDGLNRLTDAIYRKADNLTICNSYGESISYDKNGNIVLLGRTGEYDDNVHAMSTDNLSYNYDNKTNLLRGVYDGSRNTKGFYDKNESDIDYEYDLYGNLISDENKSITHITYNHLNLPLRISFQNGEYITYLYNSIGKKLQKFVSMGSQATDYLDNFQYFNGNLSFFSTPEGYVKHTTANGVSVFNYIYQYKDHLGNVRLTYTKGVLKDPIILEEDNYYPFGLKHKNYNVKKKQYTGLVIESCDICDLSKYKFNGQERQDELGLNWDSFKYRNYDPAIARFMSIDPLAEKYQQQSPYAFCENSPIAYRELEGLEGVLAIFYHGGPTGGGQPTTVKEAGTTGDYFVSTQTTAGQNGQDFAGTIIAPGWTSASGVETGMDFFNANYQDGDSVIIYGYSYGVDVAVDLAEELKAQNCNVELLVTVDGSDGPLMNSTVNTTIPSNVKTNLNVYQTENSGASSSSRSTGSSSGASSSSSKSNSSGSSNKSKSGTSNSPGSNGGPNKAANPKKTNVINKNVSAKGTNHGNIQQKAKDIIEPALNRAAAN